MNIANQDRTLLNLFASIIEKRGPDYGYALSATTDALWHGQDRALALYQKTLVLRPQPNGPVKILGNRFPNLQGVCSLFAHGLAQHPDIADEIQAAPETFHDAVTLDQAVGRQVFSGQLLAGGGAVGEALTGALSYGLSERLLAWATGHTTDPKTPAAMRANFAMIFQQPQEALLSWNKNLGAKEASAPGPGKAVLSRLVESVLAYTPDAKGPDGTFGQARTIEESAAKKRVPNGGLIPLHATMRRITLDPMLQFVDLHTAGSSIDAVLAQDPEALNAICLELAILVTELVPVLLIPPGDKAVFARYDTHLLSSLLTDVMDSLAILGMSPTPIVLPPWAGQINGLFTRRGLYAGLRFLGICIANAGLDQRTIVGQFLVFLLNSGIAALDRRMSDPGLSPGAGDRLLMSFAPALVELDKVLAYPQERKDELTSLREKLAEEAQEATADAEMAQTAMCLRNDLVFSRKELYAAALHYQEKQKAEPASQVLADLRPTPSAGPRIF